MKTIGRFDDGQYVVVLSEAEYQEAAEQGHASHNRGLAVAVQRWNDSEIGRILNSTKGHGGGSKGKYLELLFLFTQYPDLYRGNWRMRQYADVPFAFDGTIASYKQIRPMLGDVYGIGPKSLALFDQIILGE